MMRFKHTIPAWLTLSATFLLSYGATAQTPKITPPTVRPAMPAAAPLQPPAAAAKAKAKPKSPGDASATANRPARVVNKDRTRVGAQESTTAQASELGKKLDEVLARVAAVEIEMRSVDTRLQNAGLSGECPPPKLSPEQERARAEKEVAIADAKAQREALEKAIANGLPRETVADTVSRLDANIERLTRELGEIRPAPAGGCAAPMAERLASIEQAIAALGRTLAQPQEPARSADASAAVASPTETESALVADDTKFGLAFGLELASAYVFRGYNIFQSSNQMNQNPLVAPSVSFAFGDTGLSLGYWAAYQWAGFNRDALVDSGLGAEQDLFVSWSHSLVPDRLALTASAVYYFYPFASEAAAGTHLPSYLEPGLGLTYTGAVDLGLTVSYFAGVQDALADYRYLSLRPTLSKKRALTERVSAALALSGGYKLFNRFDKMKDNVWDVQVDWKLPVDVGGGFAVEPGLHFAWTNLAEVSFGDEYVVWANVATTFGI